MNQGRRKKSLGQRDEEALDVPAPALATPVWEAPKKKRLIGFVGVRRRSTGVSPTRLPHVGGARDDNTDCLILPASPK